jgi:hypothetical protein
VEAPGVYVDDVRIIEAAETPLVITTGSPLPDAVDGDPYSAQLEKTGGSTGAVWSITGGTNHVWLSIDPATGLLSGAPSPVNVGPVTVEVHVEEPTNPTNHDDKSFALEVVNAIYLETFEGACPSGWTLAADWECGTPMTVGPGTAHSGTQCIATQIDGNYSSDMVWSSTVADSPAIDLAGTTAPELSFWMWIDTEGGTYDGANLKISVNGGTTFSLVPNPVPAYNLVIDSESAWGGHQSSLGWQRVTADLSSYAGYSVILRFAFRSDYIISYPGVYIDDVMVTD